MIYICIKLFQLPTVLIHRNYRFFFYCNDHSPVHIHVEKKGKTAKFNLEPLELIRSNKFNALELRRIRKLIEVNQELFKHKWNEFFNNI